LLSCGLRELGAPVGSDRRRLEVASVTTRLSGSCWADGDYERSFRARGRIAAVVEGYGDTTHTRREYILEGAWMCREHSWLREGAAFAGGIFRFRIPALEVHEAIDLSTSDPGLGWFSRTSTRCRI
jgi:hypothetical protein